MVVFRFLTGEKTTADIHAWFQYIVSVGINLLAIKMLSGFNVAQVPLLIRRIGGKRVVNGILQKSNGP